MQVIDQKVQYAPIVDRNDFQEQGDQLPQFIRLGLYMEFDDGHRIKGPDGREHVGKGTVARFNFKSGTWSVNPPQRFVQGRMGYTFDHRMNPTLETPKRAAMGMTTDVFKREYNAKFVQTCFNHMAMV